VSGGWYESPGIFAEVPVFVPFVGLGSFWWLGSFCVFFGSWVGIVGGLGGGVGVVLGGGWGLGSGVAVWGWFFWGVVVVGWKCGVWIFCFFFFFCMARRTTLLPG